MTVVAWVVYALLDRTRDRVRGVFGRRPASHYRRGQLLNLARGVQPMLAEFSHATSDGRSHGIRGQLQP